MEDKKCDAMEIGEYQYIQREISRSLQQSLNEEKANQRKDTKQSKYYRKTWNYQNQQENQ